MRRPLAAAKLLAHTQDVPVGTRSFLFLPFGPGAHYNAIVGAVPKGGRKRKQILSMIELPGFERSSLAGSSYHVIESVSLDWSASHLSSGTAWSRKIVHALQSPKICFTLQTIECTVTKFISAFNSLER